MPATLELLPNEKEVTTPLFQDDTDYDAFREWYIGEVSDELERLQEARRRSEEESRQRLLR